MKIHHKLLRSAARGFTLVELLVVIAIIATLAALGSVAAIKAIENGRKTETRFLATSLVSAVANYYTDYNVLPLDNPSNAIATTSPTNSESSVMLTRLTNRETGTDKVNSKSIEYFNAKIVNQPRGGLFIQNGSIGLFDSWRNPLNFRVDDDYDNRIQDPINTSQPEISARILVWSYGRDNDQSVITDHVYSWK